MVGQKELVKKLKKSFRGDVSIKEEVLEKHSMDASIFEIKPKVVVFPKDSKDVISLVKFINKNKRADPEISLTSRAGGTDMTGGPLGESIVVSFMKYFNKIGKIDKNSVIVEPGVYFRDLEKETLKKGLFFPTYPASKSICALGGMIANNSGGEKSLNYGKTSEHVLELSVVLSDGKEYKFRKLNKKELQKKLSQKNFEGKIYRDIYRLVKNNYTLLKKAKPKVSKNSAGYYLWAVWDKEYFDLTQLFVGSQGTLGLITKAKLELVKKKKHQRLVVCFLKNNSELARFVNSVLPFNPESLETFDNKTLKLSLKFMPEIAKKLGRSFFSLALSFKREAFMTLFHGLPKFVVLVEMTGDDLDDLESRIKELSVELKKNRVTHFAMESEKQGEKYWLMRRESFNLLRHKVKNKRATPFIDDFIIRPKYLPEFLPKLDRILKEHNIKPTLIGHAGSGNFHIIPLMDLSKKSEREKIPIVSKKVYALVKKYNGSITAEHNDGLIRTPYLEGMFGKDIVSLFGKVKKILDPENIFNPGKKVNGDIKYSMSHVKTYLGDKNDFNKE